MKLMCNEARTANQTFLFYWLNAMLQIFCISMQFSIHQALTKNPNFIQFETSIHESAKIEESHWIQSWTPNYTSKQLSEKSYPSSPWAKAIKNSVYEVLTWYFETWPTSCSVLAWVHTSDRETCQFMCSSVIQTIMNVLQLMLHPYNEQL